MKNFKKPIFSVGDMVGFEICNEYTSLGNIIDILQDNDVISYRVQIGATKKIKTFAEPELVLVKKNDSIPVRDNVNHPDHYTNGKIECIDYIQDKLTDDEFRGYIKGNVMKYITREKHKNGDEDIKKAQWYLNRLVDVISNTDSE